MNMCPNEAGYPFRDIHHGHRHPHCSRHTQSRTAPETGTPSDLRHRERHSPIYGTSWSSSSRSFADVPCGTKTPPEGCDVYRNRRPLTFALGPPSTWSSHDLVAATYEPGPGRSHSTSAGLRYRPEKWSHWPAPRATYLQNEQTRLLRAYYFFPIFQAGRQKNTNICHKQYKGRF